MLELLSRNVWNHILTTDACGQVHKYRTFKEEREGLVGISRQSAERRGSSPFLFIVLQGGSSTCESATWFDGVNILKF